MPNQNYYKAASLTDVIFVERSPAAIMAGEYKRAGYDVSQAWQLLQSQGFSIRKAQVQKIWNVIPAD